MLHDVVEDAAVTLAQLRVAGFSAAVIEVVQLLTRRHDTPYAEYVVTLKRTRWPGQ